MLSVVWGQQVCGKGSLSNKKQVISRPVARLFSQEHASMQNKPIPSPHELPITVLASDISLITSKDCIDVRILTCRTHIYLQHSCMHAHHPSALP